jgi:outer membrane protein OmpA-like peptidoglycan-associated protein
MKPLHTEKLQAARPRFTRNWVVALLLMLPFAAFAQTSYLRHADALFGKSAYGPSLKLYEREQQTHPTLHTTVRIAECNLRLGNTQEAERYYAEAVRLEEAKPEHLFAYAKLLKYHGKFLEAQQWFTLYSRDLDKPQPALRYAHSCLVADQWFKDSLGYEVKRLTSLNTPAREIAPIVRGDSFIYAANKNRGYFFRFFNGEDGSPFYDLYAAARTGPLSAGKPQLILGGLKTKFHDGPVAFTPDGKGAYLSRTLQKGGSLLRDSQGESRLTLVYVPWLGDHWKKTPLALPFTDEESSYAYPALSPDGTTLYFASDKPGGYGGWDLYFTQREGEEWSPPKNLGPEVNSEADELFVTCPGEGRLFFASNRAEGLGGLDIFSAVFRAMSWTDVRNMGYPLNTSYDDFGLFMLPSSDTGYFSSNRPGGAGGDDLFWVKKRGAIRGKVVDARTGEPLRDVPVEILNLKEEESRYRTSLDGSFRHYLDGREGSVFVRVVAQGFEDFRETYPLSQLAPGEDMNLTIPVVQKRRYAVSGVVLDKRTGNPLPSASVSIKGKDDILIYSDGEGRFNQVLEEGQDYLITVELDGYQPEVVRVSTRDQNEPMNYELTVEMQQGAYLMLEGIARDARTGLALDSVDITVTDNLTNQVIYRGITNADGAFRIKLDNTGNYSLMAEKGNFFSSRTRITPDEGKGGGTLPLNLDIYPAQKDQVVKLIYHDVGSSAVRVVGLKDLTEIADFMRDNPQTIVEIRAHTDSRGSDEDNLRLSQRRADTVADYLKLMGIRKDRVIAQGFGETQLVNGCTDDFPCPEKDHQPNRRTEVKVIGFVQGGQ